MASRLKHLSATGAVSTRILNLKSVILTAGADVASVTIADKGDGTGATIAVLKAAAGATAVWTSGDKQGVSLPDGAYATITGTAPAVSVEIEEA